MYPKRWQGKSISKEKYFHYCMALKFYKRYSAIANDYNDSLKINNKNQVPTVSRHSLSSQEYIQSLLAQSSHSVDKPFHG